MRRAGSALVAGGLVMLALTGCRSGDEDGAVSPEPIELAGPGTTLGTGFTVVPGTRLLWLDGTEGTIDGDRPLESWSSRLELEGDAFAVYDAYVEQAMAAGFTLVRGQQGCVRTYDEPSGGGPLTFLRSPTAEAPVGARLTAVDCGFWARREADERLTFGVGWSPSDGTTTRRPSVGLDYERWPAGTLHRQHPVDEVMRYAGVVEDTAPPTAPVDPTALPQTGEPLGEHPAAARVTVLDGTQLVVPVEECGQAGFSAVLAVTAGDPDAAFTGYRDQMVTEGGTNAEASRTSLRVGEHRLRVRRWFQYDKTVELVEGMPGGEPTLLVSYCEG